MAKTVSMGSVSLADLNDIVASATAPTKPTTGVLWLDTTTNILKRWTGSAWVNQQMELKNLDPALATVIENAVASLGTMANDNLLNLAERQQLKDDLSNIVGKVMASTDKVMPTIAQLELDKKGSLYSTRQSALNAGLKSTDASYIKVATEYQNLKTYLESLGAIGDKVFPWDTSAGNSAKNIAVVKDTFRDKWLQYYLAIETLNLATTQKIKENQEELDGKIDEISLRDKTSILSGNPIYTDKADNAVVHVEVDGKSEQTVVEGNPNLVRDGRKGWASSGYNVIQGILTENWVVGQQYTITLKGTINSGQRFGLWRDTGSANQGYLSYIADKDIYHLSMVATATTATDLDKFSIYNYPSTTATSSTIEWIKIEKGSTATPIPTPSPDYPSEIKSLDKSFDIVSSVGKENLLQEYPPITGEGKDTYVVRTPVLNELEYTVSFDAVSNSGKAIAISNFFYNPNTTTSSLTSTGNTGSSADGHAPMVVTTEVKRYWIAWKQSKSGDAKAIILGRVPAGANVTISNVKLQEGALELGSEVPLYTKRPSDIPYDTQTPTLYKTNILLSEPLRSVGDVKDRLFLDTDGLWKVERNVGESNLKDTGISTTAPFGGGNSYHFGGSVAFIVTLYGNEKTKLITKSVKKILSSHFTYTPNNNYNSKGYSDVYELNSITRINGEAYSRLFIRVPESLIGAKEGDSVDSLVSKFSTWVNANNPNIVYELATPTIETLPQSEQVKLNNIQSFKGSNYVYTVDGSGVLPNLHSVFKSNTWYRVNVLGEQLVYGHRNWAVNGNFGYPLEDKDWKNYYKGTTRTIVDISSEDPPFKNALRINQTTNAVAGIIDAVIWDGAVANDLVGKSVSMATWLKYQNITSGITMQIQVTGQKADGTFVNDYYKMFSYTGTDATWKRQTGTAKIKMPDGANKVTRVLFKLGFTEAGIGEFWATGIQIETGTALGDWIPNPDDVQGDLEKTKAQLILTEKEIGFKVTKGEVIEEINLQPGQATIKAEKINFKGKVTFESFDPQVKSDFDAKATKTEAQGYANSAQTKAEANAKANTEAVAKAKADLAETTAKAYADGKVTAEEKRAIADANTKLLEAKRYAEDEILKDGKIKDTRSDNQNPDWYFLKYSMQLVREFKYTATMGIGTGVETYGILTTDVPWSGSSGGTVKQEFRVSNKTYKRSGSTTSWTAWADYDGLSEEAKSIADKATNLANSASNLAGTKAKTFTTTPTTPYASGDVWRNGSAVYISTATRTSGAYVVADWVLVGDVTSNNTAKDTASVGGTSANTIKTQASNGATAYNSTSLWQTTGRTTIDGGKVTADSITSGAIKSDVALINKLFVSDANVNVLTSKTAFINSVKSVDISADRIKTGTLSSITIDSPFNYVYEGAIRNSGNTRMANGEITMNGVFTNSYGNTFLKINPDTIYAENMQGNGAIRSMFKLSGEGLEVNKLGKSAKYTQDGIYFESGGNASVKYNSGDARIEISSYNGVALGVNSSGSFYYRISAGGGQDGLAPFVDIWTDLNLRSNLNVRGNTVKNASTVSGVKNLLFADTSNRIVQGSDNVLNIMSPSQIDMGYTNGTSTSKSLTVSNEGTVFFKKVNFSNNSVNGLNNLNNLKTMLFDGSSNRIVQASDGSMNILAPIQLNLGWTNGSSTFTTMIVTQHQIVAKKTLNMDGNNISNQSDRRLKKNIIKTERNVVDSIKKWNFVEYYWKSSDKPSGNQFGLIAQDTPELMIFEEEDDYYGIDSSRQIMLNSRGVQELAFKNDKQDLRVDGLEEKIKELETIIQEMRK